MKHFFALAALLLTVTANAKTYCAIEGNLPQSPSTYDQFFKMVEINEQKAVLVLVKPSSKYAEVLSPEDMSKLPIKDLKGAFFASLAPVSGASNSLAISIVPIRINGDKLDTPKAGGPTAFGSAQPGSSLVLMDPQSGFAVSCVFQ